MKVIVAETAGFCRGVRDALEKTMTARNQSHEDEIIYTFGPLIHNRQVLNMLEGKGILQARDIDQCAGRKVIIRAHGIPPDQRKHLKSIGARLVDATCKRVARVQGIIKRHARRGFQTIIVGDADHAEVVGLLGFTGGNGHVIHAAEEIDLLPAHWQKVLLVAQTTQNEELFQEVEKRFLNRFPAGKVINTICGATQERQHEVQRLCAEVDAMVIVGGYHSGNTVRLAEVARETLVPTYHIETEQDLDAEKMTRYRTIGVTAGASTPSWIIRNVVRFLESIEPEPSNHWRRYQTWLDSIAYSNLCCALAAAFLVPVVSALTGLACSFQDSLIAGSYVFAVHTLNRYLDRQSVQLNDPERATFYQRWQIHFTSLSLLAVLICLVTAYHKGMGPLVMMILLTGLGCMYAVPILQPLWRRRLLSILKVKDIPGSKTLAVPLAWSLVSAVIPFFGRIWAHLTAVATAFTIVFMAVLVRTAILDMIDVHGDRLAGKETMVVQLGEKKTVRVVYGVIGALAAVLLLASHGGVISGFAYVVLVVTTMMSACLLYTLTRKQLKEIINIELLTDTAIVVLGILALLTQWIGLL